MIVFGIDQGLANMGYCAMEISLKKTKKVGFEKIQENLYVKILEKGCFVTYSDDNLPKRIFRLISRLENKILEYEPDVVCCEKLFFSTPAKGSRNKSASIMNTNMITGNITYICGKHNIPFNSYPPTTVKKHLCGSGKADKEEVINKISEIFNIEKNSKNEHICDSIAIALAHVFCVLEGNSEDSAEILSN